MVKLTRHLRPKGTAAPSSKALAPAHKSAAATSRSSDKRSARQVETPKRKSASPLAAKNNSQKLPIGKQRGTAERTTKARAQKLTQVRSLGVKPVPSTKTVTSKINAGKSVALKAVSLPSKASGRKAAAAKIGKRKTTAHGSVKSAHSAVTKVSADKKGKRIGSVPHQSRPPVAAQVRKSSGRPSPVTASPTRQRPSAAAVTGKIGKVPSTNHSKTPKNLVDAASGVVRPKQQHDIAATLPKQSIGPKPTVGSAAASTAGPSAKVSGRVSGMVSGTDGNKKTGGSEMHPKDVVGTVVVKKPTTAPVPTTLPVDYRPSDAETFMNGWQRKYFRTKLLQWREDIIKQNREMVQTLHEDSQQHADMADRATSETDRAMELRSRDRQRKVIGKIDAAIARIDDGSYGFCEVTGEPISLKRLDARPIATMTLEAQESHERREKIYRDD